MAASSDRLHVILGAGPVGLTLARALAAEGRRVRVVTRHSQPALPEGVEHLNATLEHSESAVEACRDAGVVFCCVGLDYTSWPERWPPLFGSILGGAQTAGARFVFMDNLYMYGPQTEPLREDMPLTDYGRKPKVRADLTRTWREAHDAGRVQAVALRAPDFYGPEVRVSMLGELVAGRAAAGKPALLIGDIDQPHAFGYVPDIAGCLATLADADDGDYGQPWHAPNAPPVTLREATQTFFRHAGHPPKMNVMPDFVRRMLGAFNANLRELGEMRFQWDRPYRVDHSKWAARFGEAFTPFEVGAKTTIEWWQDAS
jgi:nucleoside-diphosphate-sugar epimerase